MRLRANGRPARLSSRPQAAGQEGRLAQGAGQAALGLQVRLGRAYSHSIVQVHHKLLELLDKIFILVWVAESRSVKFLTL